MSLAPARLAGQIAALEAACAAQPGSADLRTCLGMAYAMNYEAYKSMDALETAARLDPEHFYARFKYAELFYRLRALAMAEQETQHALELASSGFEVALARRQLVEIRRLMREGTQKPTWTKPLLAPAAALIALLALLSMVPLWR